MFDGWRVQSLDAAARDAGLESGAVERAFPNGVTEAITHYFDWGDRRMLAALAGRDLGAMKIRERVGTGVRARLAMFGDREVVRRTLSMLAALPMHVRLGLQITYRTVDTLWHVAGDTTTDINFYTKRLLLVGVYTATLLYWLDDASEDSADTHEFLERRLANMAQLATLRQAVEQKLNNLPSPLRLFRVSYGPRSYRGRGSSP
ncbi:MAG: hypothetical protein FD153_1378 [Rhodospirillaceae bacterium]|nr:MAG: hypothetical protein FD153_1378 [Rhodospirillaceae bacterium]